MRRRAGRGASWPRELLSFDERSWRAPDDQSADGAVARWSAARVAFAERSGQDFVVTLIGGRRWRRAAVLDGIVDDPRELQPVWDRPA